MYVSIFKKFKCETETYFVSRIDKSEWLFFGFLELNCVPLHIK